MPAETASATMPNSTTEPSASHPAEEAREPTPIETDHEKGQKEILNFPPPPDSGAEAWMCAIGGSCIFFCCLGFANSFGTFAEYYFTHQLVGQSQDNIAWIGSIAAFLQFGGGLVGGPLVDRYGSKIIRPAAIIYLLLVMMLSLCNTYGQFMAVQGVLMGLAMSFLQVPAFSAVSQYFEKNRAAAFGVVVSGSSIGGIVIPIAVSKMLNDSSLGFGWSVRIVGFMMIPFMSFAVLTVKTRLPPRKTRFWIPEALTNITFILLIIAFFFMLIGMFTPLFYLPAYAVTRGMDPTLAGYMLAIANASSTFGRIIPGILADKFGRLNVFAMGGIATGIIVFCMDSAQSNAGIIVFAIFFGFTSGTIISGATAAFSIVVKDTREFGAYMGMGMSIAALGGLVGPPVNGVLIKTYGGYFEVAMFSGATALFAGIIAFLTKLRFPEGLLGRV